MKFAIATAAMFVSLSANAAQELVRYSYSAGFSPRPGWENVVIQDDGKVRFHSEYYDRKTGKQEIRDVIVAKLSAERIKAIQALLPKIKADDLQDESPDAPLCTDAPSHQMTVATNGVEFNRFASCHNYVNKQTEAVVLKSLVDGLVSLSRM